MNVTLRNKDSKLRITNYELRGVEKRRACDTRFVIRYSLFAILLFAILTACLPTPDPPPSVAPINLELIFDDFAPAGWSPSDDVRIYDSDTLFDLVNGQADAFFAYNFEYVAVRNFENDAGDVVRIEAWQLAMTADAYGLFTRNRAGEPLDIGVEGDTDPGLRIAFWQDRLYVQVRGRKTLDDAALQSFARAFSDDLPGGGERPAIMDRLPSDGLVENGAVFFRKEISIQDEVWLGGENVLGLTSETEAVLARYDVDDTLVYLLLVDYGDAAAAGTAAKQTAQVDEFVAGKTQDSVLGVVIGDITDPLVANVLLEQALP